MPGRSRILIAEDHLLVAEACKNLLNAEFDVVGIVGNGRELIRSASELRPDVIIVDIAMPVLNGLDAGQQVKGLLPAVKLIFLTMNLDVEIAAEAFRRGASGYVLKTDTVSDLVAAVRDVLRGKSCLSPTLARDQVEYLSRLKGTPKAEAERLTARGHEVLQLLAEGRGMKEVGRELNMTTRTVAYHKYRIMKILGAKNNADLVRYAMRNLWSPDARQFPTRQRARLQFTCHATSTFDKYYLNHI